MATASTCVAFYSTWMSASVSSGRYVMLQHVRLAHHICLLIEWLIPWLQIFVDSTPEHKTKIAKRQGFNHLLGNLGFEGMSQVPGQASGPLRVV